MGTWALRQAAVVLVALAVSAVQAQGEGYVGELRDGKPHGQGVMTWPDGSRYEGELRDGRWHGQGVYTWPDGVRQEGWFRDGLQQGHGVLTWPDGARYEGWFRDGELVHQPAERLSCEARGDSASE